MRYFIAQGLGVCSSLQLRCPPLHIEETQCVRALTQVSPFLEASSPGPPLPRACSLTVPNRAHCPYFCLFLRSCTWQCTVLMPALCVSVSSHQSGNVVIWEGHHSDLCGKYREGVPWWLQNGGTAVHAQDSHCSALILDSSPDQNSTPAQVSTPAQGSTPAQVSTPAQWIRFFGSVFLSVRWHFWMSEVPQNQNSWGWSMVRNSFPVVSPPHDPGTI